MWLVGVSGGPDSMALLHYVVTNGVKVSVAHINYQKRASSLRDQMIVEKYCREHKIVCHVKMLGNQKVSGNFQDQARAIRYGYFKELIKSYQYEGVMIAHHFGDVLETFVMQEERGLLVDHIGISDQALIFGIDVNRPILDWDRSDVLAYLKDNGIDYGIDESNLDVSYRRNQIRYDIKQMSEADYVSLKTRYLKASELNQRVQNDIALIVDGWSDEVSIDDYLGLDDFIRWQCLRAWLLRQGMEVFKLSRKFFEDLDRQCLGESIWLERDGVVLCLSYGILFCGPLNGFEIKVESLELGNYDHFILSEKGRKNQAMLVLEEDFPLTFRSALSGDSIEMNYGRKKLKRWFIDQKIPRYKRKQWLIVENSSHQIIFVAGLGSDAYHSSNNPTIYVIE